MNLFEPLQIGPREKCSRLHIGLDNTKSVSSTNTNDIFPQRRLESAGNLSDHTKIDKNQLKKVDPFGIRPGRRDEFRYYPDLAPFLSAGA